MLNFLLNGGMIQAMIKLWFGLGAFSLATHFREENVKKRRFLEKKEASKIIESSLSNLQKSEVQSRLGQEFDRSIAGR